MVEKLRGCIDGLLHERESLYRHASLCTTISRHGAALLELGKLLDCHKIGAVDMRSQWEREVASLMAAAVPDAALQQHAPKLLCGVRLGWSPEGAAAAAAAADVDYSEEALRHKLKSYVQDTCPRLL